MAMPNEVSPELLRNLLEHDDAANIQAICSVPHPEVVTDALVALDIEEVYAIFSYLETRLQATLIAHFEPDKQSILAEGMDRYALATIFTEMAPDERVDLLKSLSEDKQTAVLFALAHTERENVRRLASYEEGTAGSVMTSDYVALSPGLTAGEAIEKISTEAPDKETIYYCYVVDEHRKLIGFISLKDIILEKKNRTVASIMKRNVIYAYATDTREAAAQQVAKYDLLALPVVNQAEELVGIITHDDALDIIKQEQKEDMEKFMAISGPHSDRAYLNVTVWEHFSNRIFWLVSLAVVGLFSGYILHSYEDTLTALVILAIYLPMISDTGGNTGSQSASMVIRALALNEISAKDALRVFAKELQISAIVAAVLASLAFVKVYLLSGSVNLPISVGLYDVALVIALALSIQVITATLLGAMLPIIAASIKLDPAAVASPALTTLVDMTGILIFFFLATHILNVV